MKKQCFVTVGSTQFNSLVRRFFDADLLDSLTEIGVGSVIIQCGSGEVPENLESQNDTSTGEKVWRTTIGDIQVLPCCPHQSIMFSIQFKLFRYKQSIDEEFEGKFLKN